MEHEKDVWAKYIEEIYQDVGIIKAPIANMDPYLQSRKENIQSKKPITTKQQILMIFIQNYQNLWTTTA